MRAWPVVRTLTKPLSHTHAASPDAERGGLVTGDAVAAGELHKPDEACPGWVDQDELYAFTGTTGLEHREELLVGETR